MKFVPYEKLSKKDKKRINNLKRSDWGQISPVTRVCSDKTKYNRNKIKRELYAELR